MTRPRTQPGFGWYALQISLTTIAFALAFGFYPLTLAPIGEFTNGGALGIISLSVAVISIWIAFGLNTNERLVRWLLQVPLAGIVTYMLIHELVAQFHSNRWFWW